MADDPVDAGAMDAGAMDASTMDASAMDASAMDASAMDASAMDASAMDASAMDASAMDAAEDGGPNEPGEELRPPPADCTPEAACGASTCGAAWDGCGGSFACGDPCAADEVCGTDAVRTCAPTPCPSDHWCWEYPEVTGFTLNGVFAVGPQDVWAVGDYGTILRYDGHSFSPVASPTRRHLRGVWARNGNDVWIVGDNSTVLHFDGTGVSAVPGLSAIDDRYRGLMPLYDVWGTQEGRVYAVGGGATNSASRYDRFQAVVYEFDGDTWSLAHRQYGLDGYRAISGTTARNVWVVPHVVHFDGEQWTTSLPRPSARPVAVHTEGTRDTWMACEDSLLAHWDGQQWTELSSPDSRFTGLWGADREHMIAVGSTDSAPWSPHVWSAGTQGVSRLDLPAFYSRRAEDVHGSSASDVWAVGALGSIRHDDGSGWKRVFGGDAHGFKEGFGSGPGDLWTIAPYGQVMTNESGAWRRVDIGTAEHVNGLWSEDGTGAGLWFAANGGVIIRREGDAFVDMGAPTEVDLNGVWGRSASDVWAVGDGGTALRYDGDGWRTEDIGTTIELRTGYSRSANDVWVLGASGLFRGIGGGWSRVADAYAGRSLYVGDPLEVWFVGIHSGAADHYDGSSWVRRDVGYTTGNYSVAAEPDGTIWIGGHDGSYTIPRVHRFDGASMVPIPMDGAGTVNTLIITGQGEIWAGANYGLMRYRP